MLPDGSRRELLQGTPAYISDLTYARSDISADLPGSPAACPEEVRRSVPGPSSCLAVMLTLLETPLFTPAAELSAVAASSYFEETSPPSGAGPGAEDLDGRAGLYLWLYRVYLWIHKKLSRGG